jgi:predicted alpha/beta-fold hydrolase
VAEEEGTVSEIRPATVLPAKRTPVTLHTSDGLRLVGELALPADSDPVATLICLHPLPTHGGMMDSHLFRKAAYRLPALADLAVLRFNTRGTSSEQGTSEGTFDEGEDERYDVAAAVSYAADAGLPRRWLLGWSFGTELVLRWGLDNPIEGAILLSPPLRRAGDADLDRWAASGRPWFPSWTTTCAPRRRGGASRGTRRPRSSRSPGPSTCGSASPTCASR